MSFMADWKAAKKTFEATTDKKKPSPTFRKVYQKGTGLDSTLKSLDKAKKAKDVKKHALDFKKLGLKYCGDLARAIGGEPKSSQSVYQKAVAKLKKELEKIIVKATDVAERLEEAGTTGKVDTTAIQGAEDHLALRKKMGAKAAQWAREMKSEESKVDSQSSKCKGKLAEAKRYAQANNNEMVRQTVNLIQRWNDEVQDLVKATEKTYRKRTESGSPLMKARQDCPSKFVDNLPSDMVAKYKRDSNEAFGIVASGTTEMMNTMNDLRAKALKVQRYYEQAEGYTAQMKPAAYYEKILGDIKATLVSTQKSLERKDNQTDFDKIEEIVNGGLDTSAKLKALKTRRDFTDRYRDEAARMEKDIKQQRKRADAVPDGAKETKSVEDLYDEVIELVNAIGRSVTLFLTKANRFVQECDNNIRDLS